MIERLSNAVRSMVTRGKVLASAIGGRTLLQVSGLDGVLQQTVELLLPPGYCARPAIGADIVLLQNLGSADHLIALGGDTLGNTIGNLAPGEHGLSNGSNAVIVRVDHVEIIGSACSVKVFSDHIQINGGNVLMPGLPTADPGISGALWDDGHMMAISP